MCQINHESATFWATMVATFVALASLGLSVVALRVAKSSDSVAKSSLSLAEQVAEQEQKDWKQRKWFDLYFQASEFYDHLERYQTLYQNRKLVTAQDEQDWNELMFLIRRAHSMAVVFPQTPAIDELIKATAVFGDTPLEAFSKDRLKAVFEAVQGLREKALVHPTILT